MRVFLDTNILLDVLIPGRPSAKLSQTIFQLIRTTSTEGYLSTQSILDAAYLVSRCPGFDISSFRKSINTILKFVNVDGINYFSISDAIKASEIDDIEDCAQAFFAEENNCDIIITNDSGFRLPSTIAHIQTMSPKDFISQVQHEQR